MNDKDILEGALGGTMTAVANVGVASDVHRAAQAAALVFAKIIHKNYDFDDEAVEMCAERGYALARAVMKRCAPLFEMKKPASAKVSEPSSNSSALTQEEIDKILRDNEQTP